MKSCARPVRFRSTRKSGFTLTEILIATALTLLMMAVAVNGFGLMAGSIADNRAVIEVSSRLRSAQQRLQLDLRYITAKLTPPLDPKDDLGYLEIIEGPGPWQPGFGFGVKPVLTDGSSFDSSVGDVDDVIMFTTRSQGEPFIGRFNGISVQSQVAEVAWFVRGNKLYRRQLLVLPNQGAIPAGGNYYNLNDVSVRREGGQADPRSGWFDRAEQLTPNTLGDLTKRENRFAHQPLKFPHDATFWGVLGLPLYQETTSPDYPLPEISGASMYEAIVIPGLASIPTLTTRDHWVNPLAGLPVHQINGNLNALPNGTRIGEDVILTNVIGFDVKVWDPGAPVFWLESTNEPVLPGDFAYKHKLSDGDAVKIRSGAFVDLFYTRGVTVADSDYNGQFAGPGTSKSQLQAGSNTPAVYCTWSTHYENDGVNQADHLKDGSGDTLELIDEGSNGIDDNSNGIVDDPGEWETLPPYPVPLKAIQIKIRVFEPDSGQIREVTVVQDFVR